MIDLAPTFVDFSAILGDLLFGLSLTTTGLYLSGRIVFRCLDALWPPPPGSRRS